MTQPSSRQRGSTLIDVCAACVMGSVTMALALPSYQSYLERTRRGDAVSALQRVQQAQQRYIAKQGNTRCGKQLGDDIPEISDRGLYRITMFSDGPDNFEARATALPIASRPRTPGCAQLTLRVTHGVITSYVGSLLEPVMDTRTAVARQRRAASRHQCASRSRSRHPDQRHAAVVRNAMARARLRAAAEASRLDLGDARTEERAPRCRLVHVTLSARQLLVLGRGPVPNIDCHDATADGALHVARAATPPCDDDTGVGASFDGRAPWPRRASPPSSRRRRASNCACRSRLLGAQASVRRRAARGNFRAADCVCSTARRELRCAVLSEPQRTAEWEQYR